MIKILNNDWKDAVIRPNVPMEQMKEEIIQYIKDNTQSDSIDIADGLQLGLKQVEDILDELEQDGTLKAGRV